MPTASRSENVPVNAAATAKPMRQTRLDAPALRFQRLDLPQRLIEVFLCSIAHFPRGRSIYRDRGSEKPARAGSEFVVNRHRRMNRNGFRDVSFEFYEIRMSHSSVRNIDSEIVVGNRMCAFASRRRTPRGHRKRNAPVPQTNSSADSFEHDWPQSSSRVQSRLAVRMHIGCTH